MNYLNNAQGRSIVHMDLDTFFVSCVRLENPQFKGIPLIVGGGVRGVVASCSYEARAFGVRAAMPMYMALRLCPQAKVVKGDMELFSKKSHEVASIIEENAPLMEKAGIDEFYLDISGLDKFFGCYKWTHELADKIIKETGLPISFALSINKTVSKIGTGEAKPVGKLQVKEAEVRAFLNPLSIQKIPMAGEVTVQLLSRMGIRTIKTLSEMSPEVLQQIIGKAGLELWKKANGIDNSPVEPYRERKSVSTEETFDQDTIDIPQLKSVLVAMSEQLSYQLRKEQWLTSVITVKIRYADFDTETGQCQISYTSCDHLIIKKAMELFDKLYDRRMRLRLVGIRLSGLVRGSHQMDLFEDTAELISLYQTMDKIKNRYGFSAIQRCGGAGLLHSKKS